MTVFNRIVAASAAILIACAANAAELRFAHGNSATSYENQAAEEFARLVAEKSGGDLTIAIYPAGQLGNAQEMIEGVRLGTIDIGMAGNPWMTGFNPVQNVLDIPFIFDGPEHVYRVLDGEVGEKLGESLGEHDLKLLAFWEIGFRNVINSAHPVNSIDDLKGLTIRTTGNKAHIQAFELLGANPQPMPFGEVYLALQTNVIDGTEHPVTEVYAMKFQEVTDYMTLTMHAYTALPVFMNEGRWNGLSADQQAWIHNAAVEATAFQRELIAKESAARLQDLKDAGMEVSEGVDRGAMRDAVYEQVKSAYEEQFGTELTAAIEAAR
ncbi:TRAP transporter substrate-binding protein [Psychromarinibacter sp. C21-152]|uniref:TRAP transporter substrate-binding protein n=1 Tax=Psychromarinibacter sediminicola TaxID=3033385 RepID=A0AAE3NKR2_9RHOB|nr:TRAP transporter substrate-binding protein [Psychromarinibacter sediminicola]MDF0599718.1 TRAP transporter substrate-binding protein [Psychromarinibacter sediminicola]